MGFTTKDSGKRQEFETGMRRDTQDGKPRYDLIPQFAITRWADLMARGAVKYGDSNWTLASTPEEYKRFKASAWRHFMQYMSGDREEDHMAAIFFNVVAMERLYLKGVELNEPEQDLS
jgi:hypothetical protein